MELANPPVRSPRHLDCVIEQKVHRKTKYDKKTPKAKYSGSPWVLKECIAQKLLELKDDSKD